MKRKIYEKLLEWKRRDARKVALLIDGARRVGKSWIAEEFGKNEYESHLLIDFLVTGSVVGGRHNVSAIEVKKTKRITTSSLDKFRKKFRDRLSRSYIVHTGAYSDEGSALRLPVYMLPFELEHAEGGK